MNWFARLNLNRVLSSIRVLSSLDTPHMTYPGHDISRHTRRNGRIRNMVLSDRHVLILNTPSACRAFSWPSEFHEISHISRSLIFCAVRIGVYRCVMDILTPCIKKRKHAITLLGLIAVYLTWRFLIVLPSSIGNFHCKKHSLPQGTFFKSALFSATTTFISFIHDAKGQSSWIYFVNSYNVPLH